MNAAKIIEVSSDYISCFQAAVEFGIKRTERTVRKLRGAWVLEHKPTIDNGKITNYRVIMWVSFVID